MGEIISGGSGCCNVKICYFQLIDKYGCGVVGWGCIFAVLGQFYILLGLPGWRGVGQTKDIFGC